MCIDVDKQPDFLRFVKDFPKERVLKRITAANCYRREPQIGNSFNDCSDGFIPRGRSVERHITPFTPEGTPVREVEYRSIWPSLLLVGC